MSAVLFNFGFHSVALKLMSCVACVVFRTGVNGLLFWLDRPQPFVLHHSALNGRLALPVRCSNAVALPSEPVRLIQASVCCSADSVSQCVC